MYIGDYLGRRCVYTPEKVALIAVSHTPARRYTYAQLNQRAERLACWLREQGVGKGDRVAMLAHDGIHFYDAFFACGKLGAIFAPLNWRLHSRELEEQLRLITPRLLFHAREEPMSSLVQQWQGRPGLPAVIAFDAGATQWFPVPAGGVTPVTCETLTESDTACLLFTGGTTGRPKAAQISHRQIVWNMINSMLADVRGSDIFLNIFPLFHVGGLFAFSLPILLQGGTVVQTKKFEAGRTLALIAQEHVTLFGGVPTVFQMLSEAPNWPAADLTSLRYCMSGGAPMPVPLIRRYQQEKGVVFRQGFGMTEFGPGVFSLAAEDAERKAGSIGKPNFFVDAAIRAPADNTPLPPGKIGELVLRGPTAMTGYFGDPVATAAAFDADGYFHTGDLAYVDDEGYFFIVDRLKDMFISGGENVYPAEIEAALYRHPAVAQCAVIGVPDEKWGQVGRAFVVRKSGAAVTAEELLHFLRDQLAGYKVPRTIVFREHLPVSAAGKLLKSVLREESA
ncbi:MAG: long-chain fatty acid--CoA ligase [candidate division KSB1 bacterium]|nr:long-chain fatty acid--CoA ligase [candidate division KSB1 bacterium]MDZ7275672.1 long-chain fatty acid--CoA ligase [candidate division KSB1 bacterium]MDZ7284637.1 long-chain fatty acid--CoA ligase [candidate division KSB1 bacterium]MDZ7297944.1 long-chain fatty acid--CoA ligase [candidate division KSB1 bacterium]MDZ7308327.1 long-chain fatty acid--CoA ligase [candidate division KSB1 bacterium]